VKRRGWYRSTPRRVRVSTLVILGRGAGRERCLIHLNETISSGVFRKVEALIISVEPGLHVLQLSRN